MYAFSIGNIVKVASQRRYPLANNTVRCTARGFEGIAWSLVSISGRSEHTAVVRVTIPHFLQIAFSEIQSPELAFSGDVLSPPRMAQ